MKERPFMFVTGSSPAQRVQGKKKTSRVKMKKSRQPSDDSNKFSTLEPSESNLIMKNKFHENLRKHS